ncbi:MAG: type II secretion system protein N [Steroidobacteraceae bacterium]
MAVPVGAATWFSALGAPGGLQAFVAERGPRIASAVLLGALAIEAGLVLTRNLGRGDVLPPAAAPQAAAPQRRGVDLRTIVDAHLFGQATVSSTDAPQTSIPLVLAGVLALQDPSQGMAILGPNPAQAKLYAVGAAVPGGARLHAVYRDRVLLDRGGAIESLALPRKSLVAAPPPAAVSPTPGQRLQALAQNNGALLGGLIRFQMVQASGQPGKIMGFRIYPGSRGNPTTFAQLGLHSGDLVTAVNGTPLDDASRANDVLLTLSNASSATVTLVRNGAQQDVALNLAAVANEAERAAEDSATAGGAAANAE